MRLSRAIPFALALIGVALIPRLAWWDRDPVELELAVAGPPTIHGETVPPKGLSWILNHLKATPVGKDGWNLSSGGLSPADLRGISAVYLTGGLSAAMHSLEASGAEDPVELSRHAWLSASDARALSEFTSRGEAVVGEGGLLATMLDAEALWRVEDCFRVKWTGWIGLSVEDIGDPSQSPGWVLKRLRESGDMTTVGGPAVVLMNQDLTIVLRPGIDLEERVHEIAWLEDPQWTSDEGPSSVVPYRGWFEVVKPKGICRVLAEHRLRVNERGEEKLASAGLSKAFPCFVICEGSCVGYYIAASFSHEGPNDLWTRLAGYPGFASFISSTFGLGVDRAFWEFYYPLMRRVLVEGGLSREDK